MATRNTRQTRSGTRPRPYYGSIQDTPTYIRRSPRTPTKRPLEHSDDDSDEHENVIKRLAIEDNGDWMLRQALADSIDPNMQVKPEEYGRLGYKPTAISRSRGIGGGLKSYWGSSKAFASTLTDSSQDQKLLNNTMVIDLTEGLLDLPVEVHHLIAGFLPDKDVASYASACKTTNRMIDQSFWHTRFVKSFDMVKVAGNQAEILAKKYIFRRGVLNRYFTFDHKSSHYTWLTPARRSTQTGQEQKCLDMLKSLIIDSDARKRVVNGKERIVALNQDRIREFITNTSLGRKGCHLIHDILNFSDAIWIGDRILTQPESLALAIYLCLGHFALSPDIGQSSQLHFDESQGRMFAESRQHPIFSGKRKQQLNLGWLAFAINYWRVHLTIPEGEGILSAGYRDLEASQLPQLWLGKLKTGTQEIGNHWKGVYLSIPEKDMKMLRKDVSHSLAEDAEVNESFSDFTFLTDNEKFSAETWPAGWDKFLDSNPFKKMPGKSRVGKDPVEMSHFYGTSRITGEGSGDTHFFGRIHALPTQQDIAGFQRVTMLAFVLDQHGHYDEGQVWGYEGCVLPGGRIIVGRWWDIHNHAGISMSGPFVMWNVDESTAVIPFDGEKALQFLNSINDPYLMDDEKLMSW